MQPVLIQETADWAVILKPAGLPSAPLSEDPSGTALGWFLEQFPQASGVLAHKAIEHGLLHRLDTDTTGLLLIAKNQNCCDFLIRAQAENRIRKEYFAFCSVTPDGPLPAYPLVIESAFRHFGPKRREVRPVFPGERSFSASQTLYRTELLTILDQSSETGVYGRLVACRCALYKGFRHQIRSHLASVGLPIAGDRLYNPNSFPEDVKLQLLARTVSFPDPSSGAPVTVSLPLPDKMIR